MGGRADWAISVEDPRADDVRELVGAHLAFARGETPLEYAFALDSDGLDEDSVALFGLRERGALVGIAALKELGAGHG